MATDVPCLKVTFLEDISILQTLGLLGGQGYIQGGSYGFVKKPEVTSEISTIPSVQTMMLVSQIAI